MKVMRHFGCTKKILTGLLDIGMKTWEWGNTIPSFIKNEGLKGIPEELL